MLPAGYREAYVIDAKNTKVSIWMNLAALVVMALILIPAILVYFPQKVLEQIDLVSYFLFMGGMILYIVLHELTHGAAYKLLTGEKLTYGFTLSVAYCGVPHIYVYRTAAMIAMLAPFAVFTVVFGAAALLAGNAAHRFLWTVLLAVHLGGCSGDLYGALMFLFRFRNGDTLMRDTGPTQYFYVR